MIIPRRTVAVSLLVLSSVVAACSGSGDDATSDSTVPASSSGTVDTATTDPIDSTESTTDTTATTDGTGTATSAPASDGELDASGVLDAVGPSVVYLETDWAAGTGIVLEGGYVLTNAHVVTPFDRVDVSPPASPAIEDVPVVAVDFAADLALLGPLDVDLPAAPTGSIDGMSGGDAVYLIGFPSEHEDEPTPTISEGIVSKLRTADDGLSFVQTDADIAGGQSGGALADASGRVVAISGMSVDETFALGLSLDSALERLPDLMDGGDDWVPYPNEGVTEGSVTVDGTILGGHLDVIATLEGPTRTVQLGIAPEVAIDVAVVVTLDDGTTYLSENALPLAAEQAGVDLAVVQEQIPDELILRPDLSGTYSFDLPSPMTAAITLARISVDEPFEVGVTSNEPLALWSDTDDGETIAIGGVVDGLLEPLEYQDVYLIDLAAGDEVVVTATSTLGDPNIAIIGPGETPGPTTFNVDDADLGFLGLDAQGTFTATTAGVHRIIVGDSFGQGTYQLTVERA